MAYNLKEVAKKPERLTGGHRMCAGCGAPIVVRQVLKALKPEDHAVISAATVFGSFNFHLPLYSMEGFFHSQCV